MNYTNKSKYNRRKKNVHTNKKHRSSKQSSKSFRHVGKRRSQKGGTKRQIWGKRSTPEELKQHVYLTYGTISNEGIDMFLQDVPLNENDVFYDLGSGVGNVCDHVFKKTPVRKCVGIEYDNDRFLESKELAKKEGKRQMTFIQGNFMHQDWSDATVLFMDSIMFSEDTLKQIEHKALTTCQHLRYVISMEKLPPTTALLHVKRVNIKVSWGSSQYNVYRVQ